MLQTILNAVFPVVALIGAGYICGRRNLLGAGALDALNLYVVWLALPALLFLVMAHLRHDDLAHADFVLSFLGAQMLPFIGIFWWARRAKRGIGQATIEALSGSYANTSYMGIPVLMAVLGEQGMLPMAISTVMTVCVQFAGAIALIERERALSGAASVSKRGLALTLLRNPLVAGPLAGGVYAVLSGYGGFGVPAMAETALRMVGNSASPCALVTIGLFLAVRTPAGAAVKGTGTADGRLLAMLVTVKLLVQPAIALGLAFYVFPMDKVWASSCVLLAATPNGTGAFMLARLYNREAGIASRAILVSTLLSVVTLPLFILLMP